MNHTIKGIIIVAAITSMLVVGANMIPIMQNSFAYKRSDFKKERDPNTNTNINTNTNSADSTSSSTATADNTNNINNTASSAQSQEQSACAVAVTCPEGNAQVGQFSLGALTNQWWDWIFSLNTVSLGGNPIFDKTGALCSAGIQQNGMLFLVGTGGVTIPPGQPIQEDTSYQRTCTTPLRQGTPILIPIINAECSPIEFGYDKNCNHQPAASTTAPPCPQSQTTYAAALRSEVNKVINHATRLNIAVDGVPLTSQRAQSPDLGHCMTIMPNNPFADPVFGPPGPPPDGNPLNVNHPTTVQSIADGYWVLITNLSPGQHTLDFGGTIVFPNGASFVTKATYHLTIV
jgi:hypothetical protein